MTLRKTKKKKKRQINGREKHGNVGIETTKSVFFLTLSITATKKKKRKWKKTCVARGGRRGPACPCQTELNHLPAKPATQQEEVCKHFRAGNEQMKGPFDLRTRLGVSACSPSSKTQKKKRRRFIINTHKPPNQEAKKEHAHHSSSGGLPHEGASRGDHDRVCV